METLEKDYSFEVSGVFAVANNLKPIFGAENQIIGFELPGGRQVRLIIGIGIENKVTGSYEHVTNEQQMDDLGFGCLDYDKICFTEIEHSSLPKWEL